MAFDSTVMTAVVAELQARLLGGRISKIYQPEPDELALLLYSGGSNYRLLLSANARQPRIHLTAIEKKNPPAPPTFCMLMRKYIEGGRILAINQVGRDRICRMRIGVTDELGNPAEFTLVTEVMGKHSNIVLLNPHGRIVDAVRRISEEVNRYRELLPGLPYIPPPPTEKLDPTGVTGATLQAAVAEPGGPAWQFLLDTVDGLGPMLAREAVVRSGAPALARVADTDLDRLAAAVHELIGVDQFEPRLLYDQEDRLKEFHVIPLRHWPGRVQTGFATVSACLDAFYGGRAEEERFRALRGSLAKIVRDEIQRVRKKLKAQRESLQTAENAEAFRVQGELITSNLWQVKKGDTIATVVNYYDPEGGEVTIPLDPQLTPAENAQAYYRRYQKARSGLAMIQEQLAKSEGELAYLEQVEVGLATATSLPDLEEVRRELIAEGYMGDEAKEKRKEKAGEAKEQKAQPPLTIRSSDGLEIWVGRNNRQNDYLTLKLAAPHDLWFHTKEIPGSHVILRVPPGREVPERSIHEAAALAAYHSKGRDSSGVPVDYTLRKHVRKPSGARPGMVIYDNQKTLWVTPDPELLPVLRGGAGHGGVGSDDPPGLCGGEGIDPQV